MQNDFDIQMYTMVNSNDSGLDEDVSQAVGCRIPEAAFCNVFSIDPAGPDTQIHAAAAFDGDGIWVVYNRPQSKRGAGFTVWAVRLHCDGTQAVPPFMISHQSNDNNVDPALAISGSTVMFAWPADNGGNPNLSIWYRTYKIDGTPIMPEDRQLDMSGTASDGLNAWMVQLAPMPNGRFAMTCAAGVKGYDGFQVLLGTLDSTGKVLTKPTAVAPDAAASQVWPTVATDGDGGIFLAWESQDSQGNSGVRVLVRTDPKTMGSARPIDPYPGHDSASPSYASSESGEIPWLAFQSSGNSATRIVLRNGSQPDNNGYTAVIDNVSGMNHTPLIKSVSGGGAVVWYRVMQGVKNEVWFQEFRNDHGNPVPLGKPAQVNHNPAAPYAPAMAVLPNGYFIAWSEGKNPDFRINGVFVRKSL